MADNNSQIQKAEAKTIKAYFESPTVKSKFEEILGKKAPAFMTSLLQVANGSAALQACSPVSIFNAAATAATLDLPINPNLGFAWILPYKGQAMFQIGWRGFVQLAQRSGQYARITTAPIFENQFKHWNAVTEDLNVDSCVEGAGPIVGYVAFFRLRNGYEKVDYWTRDRVYNHAKRFSKNFDGNGSIWKSDFDAMAMKTVLKNTLSKWGPLSVQMEKAIQVDQSVINDERGDSVTYIDNLPPDQADKAGQALDDTAAALKGITQQALNQNQGGQ